MPGTPRSGRRLRAWLGAGLLVLAVVVLLFLAVHDDQEAPRAARSERGPPPRVVLRPEGEPVPAQPPAAEPEPVEPSAELPAVANELAARVAAIDAALNDPERLSEVPGLVAALLLASTRADQAEVLEALSKVIRADSLETSLTGGFAAFVYGALAPGAGPLPLAQLPSDSWRFRLLLLGSRVTLKAPIDESQLAQWTLAVRGATLHALKRWDPKHALFVALADDPRSPYPNRADFEAWGQVTGSRVLPGFLLDTIRERLPDATEFGPRSRQWVVRSVLRSGLRNPEERQLAYEWLRLESDPETRAELLSGPMRSGGPDDAAALQPRLEELVAEGAADAPNALRLLFALNRERALALCREHYALWKPHLREVAARETLFRQGEAAVAAFARQWEQEKEQGVLEAIFSEIDRQGFPRFPGERDSLLRLGDAHYDLLVELSKVPRTSKLAKRWLDFLGRSR